MVKTKQHKTKTKTKTNKRIIHFIIASTRMNNNNLFLEIKELLNNVFSELKFSMDYIR